MDSQRSFTRIIANGIRLCLTGLLILLSAEQAVTAQEQAPIPEEAVNLYALGPNDVLSIQVLEAEEINGREVRIDNSGFINLPMVGRLQAAGLTLRELEEAVSARLSKFIREPQVAISVSDFRSQPVSILGAVNNPGVHQLQGPQTLLEVVSLAGGLRQDAAYRASITRRAEQGPIPLAGAGLDESGRFFVAEADLASAMEGQNPAANILVRGNDVISVPRAPLIYIMGEVKKPGGFVLDGRESITVLGALARAEGLAPSAAPAKAMIVRGTGTANRTEIPVDLKGILKAEDADVHMKADDLLFVPASGSKRAFSKALETAVTLGLGLAIYRR
jgi:polysaccharide export outer membrane protein